MPTQVLVTLKFYQTLILDVGILKNGFTEKSLKNYFLFSSRPLDGPGNVLRCLTTQQSLPFIGAVGEDRQNLALQRESHLSLFAGWFLKM